MTRPDPVETARRLVAERHPGALQAWLGGSAAVGNVTGTSDLDVVVLTVDGPVHRESFTYGGWPVEAFVHTEASLREFVEKDRSRRRPTLARMVSAGVPLREGSSGTALALECAAVVAAGPGPVGEGELALMRYVLTDLLDDLEGGGAGSVRDAVVLEVWRNVLELTLAAAPWWSGNGKWLVREVEALDSTRGTDLSGRIAQALRSALAGDPRALVELAEQALASAGGRLWSGFRMDATSP